MAVCVCICVNVSLCSVPICVCVHVSLHVCVCVCMRMSTCRVPICACVQCMFVCAWVSVYVFVCPCVFVFLCISAYLFAQALNHLYALVSEMSEVPVARHRSKKLSSILFLVGKGLQGFLAIPRVLGHPHFQNPNPAELPRTK